MAFSNLKLLVRKTRQDLFKSKQNLLIAVTVLLFCFLSIGIGFTKYGETYSKVKEYRKETPENWEHRPDKYPVLMATHDIFNTVSFASNIGIMKQGELVQNLPSKTFSAQELQELYLKTI